MAEAELWQWAGNYAQLMSAFASVLALAFAFAAFIRARGIGHALDFDRGYKTHRSHIAAFWKSLRSEWKKMNPDLELDITIANAGMPPGFGANEIDMACWRKLNENCLNLEEKRILEFASKIYPRRDMQLGEVWQYSSITPENDAKCFHEARGELSWFWDIESEAVRLKHFRIHHDDAWEMLVLIAWLEIALCDWTRVHGPGKVRLFKLLQRAWPNGRSQVTAKSRGFRSVRIRLVNPVLDVLEDVFPNY